MVVVVTEYVLPFEVPVWAAGAAAEIATAAAAMAAATPALI